MKSITFGKIIFISVVALASLSLRNSSLAKVDLSPVLLLLLFNGAEDDNLPALEVIADYAEQGLVAPTVQTYATAGILGVTQDNLAGINSTISSLNREQADSIEEIQAIVDSLLPDIFPPVIGLVGANPMRVVLGQAFIDPGASAQDDRDGTVQVTATHNVNSQVAGSYTVTYSSSDSAGNQASKTREVRVGSGNLKNSDRAIAYLTSWGLPQNAGQLLQASQVDTYLLAFGQWGANGTISTSDGIATIPVYDPYWMPTSYIGWTNLILDDPDRDVLVSFGGQTYESIWAHTLNAVGREQIAQSLAALVATDFPVYKKGLTDATRVGPCLSENYDSSCNYTVYQLAGYVQLAGMDFDFEKATRISAAENSALLALSQRVRELVGSEKLIGLTTYHVGADPVSCESAAVTEGCSYTEPARSTHHGEVLPLIQAANSPFDFFNVMAFDAGTNFHYDVAMHNYGNAVGDDSKVVLGLSINSQWAATGAFVQTAAENTLRAQWQGENGFGGIFVWALGANTENMSFQDQISTINQFIDAGAVEETSVAIIADYAASSTVVPSLLTYLNAGIVGVTSANLAQVNQHIRSLNRAAVDTRAEIQAVVDSLIPNTVPPVISMAGDNPMDVEKGQPFIDPGATAQDDRDGSVPVTAQHAVNTQALGSYPVIYTAFDRAANSVQQTRNVNVVSTPDTIRPVISLNGENPLVIAKDSVFVDPGATAQDDRDGIVAVSQSNNVDTQVLGRYSVTYTARDNAGNEARSTRNVDVIEDDLNEYFYQSTQDPVGWQTAVTLTYKKPGTELQMRDARFVLSGFESHGLSSFTCETISWIQPMVTHETDPDTGKPLTIIDLNYGTDDWLDTKFGGESSPVATCTITLSSSRITDNNGQPIPGSTIRMVDFVPGKNQVVTLAGDSSLPNRADPVDLHVKGWPSTLAMGSVTDNNYGLNAQFAAAKVDAIFKYEGDGFGDRGDVIEPGVTQQTITHARGIEAIGGKKVMPTMVVYTANGSGGGVAPEDILDYDNLRKHFQNTIRMCSVMQFNKDTDHPHPASIVLNADLFGEWQKNLDYGSFGATYGDGDAIPWVAIPIKQAMLEAIDLEAGYLVSNTSNQTATLHTLYNLAAIRNEINSGVIADNIKGWVQSQNFMIRRFSPDVPFGWVINLWNPGSANWAHNQYAGLQAVWDDAPGSVARFVEWIGAYEDNAYRPDFLTFDKYERDGFSPAGKPNYAFGAKEWDNYLTYVKQITDYVDTPAMIWQIPGGHMATIGEDIGSYDLERHSASGGTYFMGDESIGTDINNIRSEVLNISLAPSVYEGATNVAELLMQSPDHDWGQSRLRKAAYSNVFAILWGGGETTGIVPISTNGTGDNEWLKNKVLAYEEEAQVPLYHSTSSSSNPDLTTLASLNNELQALGTTMDSSVLLYQQPDLQWVPSNIYKWDDFLAALSVMHNDGVAGVHYWLFDENLTEATKILYSKVAIAGFLAQSMKETIQYDACDENNWARTVYGAPTDYPMSAACGQLGQKYADYGVVNGVDNPYSCPRNPKMETSAITNAKWYGAPAPLFTAPDAVLESYGMLANGNVGRWDYNGHCSNVPEPDEVSSGQVYLRGDCYVYVGQKAGSFIWDGSSEESLEGCGWWGRGVIQTTGRENFGKLNHFIGRSHVDSYNYGQIIRGVEVVAPPADPLYADMDLCSNPEFICSSTEHKELKWIAGLFFWMNEVQGYNVPDGPYAGWDYHEQLKQYVDNGLQGTAFIDDISGIVNRGCPDTTCPGSGGVDGLIERRANFVKVLEAMGLNPQ